MAGIVLLLDLILADRIKLWKGSRYYFR